MEEKGLLQKSVSGPGAEEQTSDELDSFMAIGMKIIHSAQVAEKYIPGIVQSEEPAREIANLTVNVTERVEGAAESKGKKVPIEVLAQGANILMGDIIQVAEMSGMQPMNDEEKYMTYSLAISQYLDNAVKSGKMTPEELQKLSMEAQSTEEGQAIVTETQNAAGQMQGAETAPPVEAPAAGGK